MAAAEAGVPVVRIAIRGTRSVLGNTSWLPHRGIIQVPVGPPIQPEEVAPRTADPWQVAVALRDAARTFILQHCGEPDSVQEELTL